jgi:signal-transduction protein with cAMP-binding, CBS, and nucleotidyltransferase domain
MDSPLRRPEEILAYRPLREILSAKPRSLWSVAPADTAFSALQIMAEKDIGFLVVLERGAIAGVLSERDCARRLVLERKPPETTPVRDLMVREVVTVDPTHTFADCLRLMHRHGIRHLPVIESGKPVAVVSIRDLLGEAVAHHARIIGELERERLEIFTSTA